MLALPFPDFHVPIVSLGVMGAGAIDLRQATAEAGTEAGIRSARARPHRPRPADRLAMERFPRPSVKGL